MKLKKEDGNLLIKAAKSAISARLKGKEPEAKDSLKSKFSEKQGVFVTITIDGELRGCIGFIEGIFPLWEAVVKAAQSAAFEDPRFMPLTEDEFKTIKVEVSVLTKPEQLKGKPDTYVKQIEIGKHGLIAEMGYGKGLLLPQVFTEYKVNAEKALEMTCQKAGLPPNSWKEPGCKVYKFSCQIFTEH